MIKASAALQQNRRLYVLGLSEMNVRALRAGMPIKFDLESIGGVGDMVIFWGETESSIMDDLSSLIGPDTRVNDTRA